VVVLVLLCICAIISGAFLPKPAGWAVVALAVVALLFQLSVLHR
jgi:hypothetical protein